MQVKKFLRRLLKYNEEEMKSILIFALFLSLYSCNNEANHVESVTNIDSSFSDSTILKPDSSLTSLDFIRDWKGQYPQQVNMFENSTIQNRLSELLKAEYDLLKINWNVQTPFEEENGIFTTSGCQQHDCPSYHSIVYFDINNNNINVVIMKDKEYKLFVEKDTILLPQSMKKDLEINKGNL